MKKDFKIFDNHLISFFFSIIYCVYFHLNKFVSNLGKEEPKMNVNTDVFENYIKINNSFWTRKDPKNTDKVLITDLVHHPGIIIKEFIFGNYVSEFYNLDPYALVDYTYEFNKKIIKSFNVKNFIYQPKISFIQRLINIFKSYKMVRNVRNIDEFIALDDKKINYGRCVYDHILRNTSGGTLEKINYKIFFFLSEAIFYNDFYENLFLNNNFKYLIMSETQFLPSNIILQNALEYNVKVVSRIGGPSKIGARLYDKKNEKFQSNIKISKDQFNDIFKDSKDIYSKKGYEIIKNLYDGTRAHHDPAAAKNYVYNKDNFKTSKDLLKYFKWNNSRKICTIYSHNLFDGNYYNEWRIFRDNLTWLRKTLTYIKNKKLDVNWIVKDHPSDYGNNRAKNTTYNEFKKIIGKNDNIKFFPNEFKSQVLKDVTDCLFTSQGSAGIEFPCFGIPSIICGDAYYQGLGFTIEPKNELEYYNVINNLDKIISNGLDDEQMKNARSAYYFSEEMIKTEHPLLFNYSILRNLDLNDFFSTAASKINNYNIQGDFLKISFKNQLENNKRHSII